MNINEKQRAPNQVFEGVRRIIYVFIFAQLINN